MYNFIFFIFSDKTGVGFSISSLFLAFFVGDSLKVRLFMTTRSFKKSVLMKIISIISVWVLASGVGGCKKASSADGADQIGSQLMATSLKYVAQGNQDRCGDDDGEIGSHNNIYDDVYDKSEFFFKTLVGRVKKDRHQKLIEDSNRRFMLREDINFNANTRSQKTIIESVRMLLNIMGDHGREALPDRPIHPAAFFSVIRDFESNKSDKWSNDEYFLTTHNCKHGPCYGLFQIDLVDLLNDGPDRVQALKSLCGDGGLGFLGQSVDGALDFCAALQWWNGGNKCNNLRIHMGHVFENQRPTKNGDKVCVPLSQVQSQAFNPCNHPETPWTPKTFAYGYFCAYIQHNQWKHYGIYDTWGRAYTGFNTSGVSPLLEDNQEYKGYEYCAIKRYLKQLKTGKKCIKSGDSYDVSQRPPPPQLIQASVADFACKIGLLPSWLQAEDCKKVDPFTPFHGKTTSRPVDGHSRWMGKSVSQKRMFDKRKPQTTQPSASEITPGCENGVVEL